MKVSITLALCLVVAWLAEARPEAPGGHQYNPRGGSSRGGFRGGYSRGGYGGGDQDYEDANYNFMYEVQDGGYGVDFGHKESRSGDLTQGNYHVLLPDGRVQTVDYTADQGGYRSVVNYQGGARGDRGYGGYRGAGGGADGRFRRGGHGGQQGGYGGHQGSYGGDQGSLGVDFRVGK